MSWLPRGLPDGVFVHSPVFDAAVLRDLFQANVLTLLLKERMISQELVERMREWRHSGFHAYTGHRDYDYLEWIARLTSHIPDRGTHLVHYYGAYRRTSRPIPRNPTVPGLRPAGNRGRLIRRVYEVDPLLCPCGQRMRVVGFIAQAPVIRKILAHIGRRFDPLKLPGRSPPLLDDLSRDPFPSRGPQYDVAVLLEDLGLSVAASLSDIGTQDTHIATIDWGDGNSWNGPAAGPVTQTHTYANTGDYLITFTVTDDDRGEKAAVSEELNPVGVSKVLEKLMPCINHLKIKNSQL